MKLPIDTDGRGFSEKFRAIVARGRFLGPEIRCGTGAPCYPCLSVSIRGSML